MRKKALLYILSVLLLSTLLVKAQAVRVDSQTVKNMTYTSAEIPTGIAVELYGGAL
jgi:hypothetical protein